MGGVQEGEKMTCEDCLYFKLTRGSRNWHGLQLEPDDAECVGNASERELDKYFTDAEDGAENCTGFRSRYKEDNI